MSGTMPSRRKCLMFQHEGKNYYIYTDVAGLESGVRELYGTEQLMRHFRKCFANRGLLERFRCRCGWGVRCKREGVKKG